MAKKYHESRRNGSDSMIKNDNSKIANMPQEIKMEQYPYPSMMDETYNDGISGIDSQMDRDHGKLRSQFKPRKF